LGREEVEDEEGKEGYDNKVGNKRYGEEPLLLPWRKNFRDGEVKAHGSDAGDYKYPDRIVAYLEKQLVHWDGSLLPLLIPDKVGSMV
jgi:hypothetical protein